ncbi:antibiotic biosynthesis monooxygenase family protein [Acidovorax sp. NCPPB 4044]|uniref:antibiotic biosynthesis monooxygenase family protein n=1 Tax=Acidovorax sp. NCPPB 4044 TaxID=2940490 RepID=UPI0023029629|nr:antibiotic biosynthesis monooxygenase [Acidovorax sp. NCPPB 4044]MDA8521599.1 antibiotic biosynthesis monooxygenase [Acidovorax sp. NCPPB 4044]
MAEAVAAGRPARPRITSTFTFMPGAYDAEFHALDEAIARVARSLPGYLGEETWENPSTGLVSNVYYWESLEALQALMQHPDHLAAKARQAQWLAGYQVVIAEVIASHGDGRIAHPLAGGVPLAGGPAAGRASPLD